MSTPVFIPEMLLLASLTDSSVSLFMSVFCLVCLEILNSSLSF